MSLTDSDILSDESDNKTPTKDFNGTLKNLKSFEIQEIGEKQSKILRILKTYFEILPKEYFEFILDLNNMFAQCTNYCNTKFYWIICNKSISGLFIYSCDMKSLVIHHLSCLKYKLLPILIDKIWKLVKENEVIVQFWRVSVDFETFWNKNQLKIHAENKDNGIIEYKYTVKSFKIKYTAIVKACNIIESSEKAFSNTNSCKEMIEIGNKHCLISNLLNLYENNSDSLDLFQNTPVKLQQDINEILEIIISLDYKYPYIQNFKNIKKKDLIPILKDFPTAQVPKDPYISMLNLDLRLKNCTFLTRTIEGVQYKYMRFGSIKEVIGDDNSKMYILPLNDLTTSIFFINSLDMLEELTSSLEKRQSDLYYYIDNLIKTFVPCDRTTEAFWVPCFKKEFNWSIPWIEGCSLCPNKAIRSCHESGCIELSYSEAPNSTLKYPSPADTSLTGSFVFGVYNQSVKEKLDCPLFISLIQKDNWIKYK